MIILKKQPSKTLNSDLYQTIVTSYTKGTSYELTLSSKYITADDHVLIVDDFLANGAALEGLCDIVGQAGAEVVGAAVAIEKAFQPGGERLRGKGLRIEALARIASMSDDSIEFCED